MQVDISPPAKINIGDTFSSVRTPIITVYDSEGNSLQQTLIQMRVIDFFGCTLKDKPICDFQTRLAIQNTLEYIRFAQVCGLTLENAQATTDSDGSASFPDTSLVLYALVSFNFVGDLKDCMKFAMVQMK